MMKDPYANLYDITEIHDLRDVIKHRVKDFPQNPVFLVKEKRGGEYVPISTEKYDHDIDSLGTYFLNTVERARASRFSLRQDTNGTPHIWLLPTVQAA